MNVSAKAGEDRTQEPLLLPQVPMSVLVGMVLLVLMTLLPAVAEPEVPTSDKRYDISALAAFWPVYEQLRADKDPAPALWKVLFETPAWRSLGPRRQRLYRDLYPLVFKPSRAADYAALVEQGGHRARLARHLQQLIAREQEMRFFYRAVARREAPFDVALEKARAWLPEDSAADPLPKVALAFWAADGIGGDPIVLDLMFAKDLGSHVTDFLGHEFHHVYHGRLLKPLSPPEDATLGEVILVRTLLQLQREGVAGLIDKKTLPVMQGGWYSPLRARAFNSDVARAPQVLEEIEVSLRKIADADGDTAKSLAQAIQREILPQYGRATGFYMTHVILEASGRETLMATLDSPFSFIRSYNQAADQIADAPQFSDDAMALLDRLEMRFYGRDEALVVATG